MNTGGGSPLRQEATTIYRELAEANRAAYLPDLATSLWAVGWICVESDMQPEAGLIAVEEAVALYEGLAQRLPARFEGHWRSAQSAMADLLDVLGRVDEAAQIRGLLEPSDG